jgi:oxygen-independent coproporphyrinogen-3 oxidase
MLEWKRNQKLLEGTQIASIYFGGGTPSLFPEGIGRFLQQIRFSCSLLPDCEITVEANPEESSPLLFETLLQLGANRLSVGVQSLDDRSLVTLERIHNAEKAIACLQMARKAGFSNISIDLMYDLPDQTLSSWEYTLDQVADLQIQHLSLYNLTIEPNTAFDRIKKRLQFPDSELSLKLLKTAVDKLEGMGLERYEISAFAKPGFASRHNLGYWTGRPFLGFGPSAFSFWEGTRYRNKAHLNHYVKALKEGKSPVDFSEKLPFPQNVQELFAVQLRTLAGAKVPEVSEKVVTQLVNQGLLARKGDSAFLTDKGLLFYDTVASEII